MRILFIGDVVGRTGRVHRNDAPMARTAADPLTSMSTLATLAAMRDPEHFARMAQRRRCRSRPAAILFADLGGSSPLARRLSTERDFALGRRMALAADSCIVEVGGITGRHVGDGVVSFFVAENLGSESAAAAGAICAAGLSPARWPTPTFALILRPRIFR